MDLLDETVLAAIYEGPLEDAPWQGFVGLLRHRFDVDSSTLHFRLPSVEHTILDISDSQWDIRILREHYGVHYDQLNPFDFESMTVGVAYAWEDFVSRKEFLKSEFYTGFCRPMGFEYALCMRIDEPSGLHMWLTIARNNEQGIFCKVEVEQFQRLFPHLQRALKILVNMQKSKQELLVSQVAIERMDIGTVVLDEHGDVISANETAQNMAQSNDSFSLKNNRLQLNDSASQKQLLHLIKAMLAHPEASTTEALSLVRQGKAMPGLLLRTFPASANLKTVHRPALIIYLTDPASHRVASQHLVAQLFGLTKAEAKLATLLADGLSPAEAARVMHVTEDTTRSYCKRIYAKTGMTRQAELVRLILKSVASLAVA
ncbi:MAG: helix-turn-helix transcriptional regulator [Gammaproteobacteria bacterium]|nr:helix-turn-helix transcriptional regulator [Gammaproteobacteria bacterium]